MKPFNTYESQHMRNITGETLRPGDFSLTDKGIKFCKFSKEDSLLDLGSGMGAAVYYIYKKYGIKAIGLDPSDKLINAGMSKYENIKLIHGRGENIPFKDESFKGVLAECTLSLMDDLDTVISEVFRVLKKEGWFIVNDVYAKRPEFIDDMNSFSVNSCMRGLHNLEVLKSKLEHRGFNILLFQDCSHMLKQLMVKTIFTYGSMAIFWNKAMECSVNGCQFEEVLRRCKPGYFIIIAKRGDK
ncbi:DVU_1556 family methyltransferase [Clostridium tyrobutyricum]|uniref:DVU_1556 family methyltransferase n=1 Tax=Clostridium tyrobutyricum TaxID=1519 RepID=UPI00057C62B4|nr:class I SAM-dependent methyltransferase [Clostridium tyrobutyricum]